MWCTLRAPRPALLFSWVVSLGSLALICQSASPSHAAPRTPEQEQAQKHFVAGRSYFEKGDYLRAKAEFEASYKLSKLPDLLFNLSLVSEAMGVYTEAVSHLEDYLRLRPNAADRQEIEKRIVELHEKDRSRQAPNVEPPPAPLIPGVGGPPPATTQSARAKLPLWPGIAVVSGGVLFLGIGAGLAGAATAQARADEMNMGVFDPQIESRGQGLSSSGIAFLTLSGVALAAGGGYTLYWYLRRDRAAGRVR